MLYSSDPYLWSLREKLENRISILLVILVLLSVFNPSISLFTFHVHLDNYLAECQQDRHHTEDCRANCILEEMMPEQPDARAERTVTFSYFFPALFFQNYQLTPTSLLSELIVVNCFSHHLMLYSSPDLGMLFPPPKLG